MENQPLNTARFWVLCGIILAAALYRIAPHPLNASPVAAMALFGGAHFDRRWLAFALPLAAMVLSDAVIGFHGFVPVVYLLFAATVAMGVWLRGRVTPLRVLGVTLGASLLFFLVSNFAYWAQGLLYPRTLEGLAACYVAALPFFQNTLLGNLFFAALFFGGFALAQRRYPALRPAGTRLADAA